MPNLLVVDDSWLSRNMVSKILKGGGHDVREAVNGIDALAKLEEEAPDCMVLDLLMPELDGFGVLEGMQEKSISLPVIVMSADIQESSKERCLLLGARCVLNKPPNEDELIGAIGEALG